jgi:hypothetical protein
MTNVWNWIVVNWGPLGIGTGIGAALTGIFNLLKWKYPSGTEWKRARLDLKNKALDARIIQALYEHGNWRSSRGMTGAGMPLTRISELAIHLNVDRDAVEESLSRLEVRRRVGTSHGDWFPIPD